MRIAANYGFHDLDAQVDREYGEAFEVPDARAERLVELGVCHVVEQPKPKPSKKPKKKTDK